MLNILKFANISLYFVMVLVNVLAERLPINGKTTGEISDAYPNLFAPAGITFSIWGLIYLMLLGFILYQSGIYPKNTDEQVRNSLIKQIDWLFVISCIANAGWIILWHYEKIFLTIASMCILLISLIGIYIQLQKRSDVSKIEKLLVKTTFSVYLGWISVATIANVTILLVSIGWDGFGISPQIWTIITIALAIILGGIFLVRNRDIAFAAVVIWALTGIIIKHINYFNVQYPAIIAIAAAGSILLLAGILFLVKKDKENVSVSE